MIKRKIQSIIESVLFKGKAIILYGPRQVGKTTLLQALRDKVGAPSVYLNCDEPDIRRSLTDQTSTELSALIGDSKVVLIDEAQRVRNIGITLKLLVDQRPDLQVIATGSSSFELANKIFEPLTGRVYTFHLYPISLEELRSQESDLEMDRLLERRMIYGLYPEIVERPHEADRLLKELTESYLYKDVLEYHHVKKPEILEKLLQALALQIGQEVSFGELSRLLGVQKTTVEQYLNLLERSFIVFRLNPFQRNLRTELRKLRKVYFFDTGIRNAIIRNLNPLELRQDTGALWENFLISERVKFLHYHQLDRKSYFWRTQTKLKLDYLEEFQGKLEAFEMKWEEKKWHPPKAFLTAYPDARYQLIHRKNYRDFIG